MNACDYTDTSMTVDGLTDVNISNLSNSNPNNIHQVQVVLDHSKAINLDWAGVSQDTVQYRVNGTYKTASQMSDSDWNNVTAVKVSGNLDSGSSAKVVIPVKLANSDQIKSDLQDESSLGSSINRYNSINLSAQSDNNSVNVTDGTANYYYELPAYSVMNAVNKETQATGNSTISPRILVNIGGHWQYIPVKDLTFPHLDRSDFVYTNIGHTTPSETLFTDGIYQIKLDKIFNAIKDKGYSVNINNNGNQYSTWPVYSYNGFTGNRDASTQLYVQVQQIFVTKDLTLNQGDSWNSNDSLVSANIEFYNLDSSGFNGAVNSGSKDLKATGSYTYDLYDANGNKIAECVPVGQNVPTLAEGVYKVVYHYAINNSQEVSKTATITVKNNNTTPTEPDTPNVPDKSDTDNTDTNVPVKPTKPSEDKENKDNVGPVKPQKPTNNKDKKNTATAESKNQSNQGSVVKAATISNSSAVTDVSRGERVLPQTGEKDKVNTSIIGLLAAVIRIFGLVATKCKKN